MKKSPRLEILCLRHGKTKYTEIFPDLTPEGIKEVRFIAGYSVLPWILSHNVNSDCLKIISSPAQRALGTAKCVADMIGYTDTIVPMIDIAPMVRRDPARAALAYAEMNAGRTHVSYENDIIFQDATIFETPPEVRLRWYKFFARYIRSAHEKYHHHTILVSHYEVLCNLVKDLFGIEASEATELRHAEPIVLSVSGYDEYCRYVTIIGTFRGVHALAVFDLTTYSLERRA